MVSESPLRGEELQKEGWVKQFVASEPRLSEAVNLYTELGFEVHLEPLPKGQECDTCSGPEGHLEKEECRICFEGFEDQYKIIFTRRRKGSNPSENQIP
jgi:hypothetical protein